MAIRGRNRIIGFSGENKAAKFLKKQGYEILKRNFRCPFGEVDIIARKGETVVFAEVKTRTGDTFGEPNESVGTERMSRYKNCVRYFYVGREIADTVRFDVIEVTADGINHIENAFF